MRRIILKSLKELITYNKKITICAIALICFLIVAGIILCLVNSNKVGDTANTEVDSAADIERSGKLLADAKQEIDNLKKEIPALDRDTFVTIDNKVVVGFVEIKGLNINYPVINVYNDNTYNYSMCRTGDNMPWDIEGMTIYGIESYTESLNNMKDGDTLIFEDVAGEKYEYLYDKDYAENNDNNNVKNYNDYGIKICTVEKNGNEKKCYCFVKKE